MAGLLRTLYTNFSAGELTDKLATRLDLSVYRNGASRLRNWRQLLQGGVQRRMGLRFAATLPATTTEAARIEEFAYQDGESYAFVFGQNRVDIYDDDGVFVQSITSMPWGSTRAKEMSVEQAGKYMWIAHRDFPLREIVRDAASSFSSNVYAFDTDDADEQTFQPYYNFVDPSVTLLPAAYTGTGVTVTASTTGVFTSDHVGTIIRYAGREMEVASYVDTDEITVDIRQDLPKAWVLTVAAGDEAGFSVGQVVTGEDASVPQGRGIVTATASASITVQGITGDDPKGFEDVDRVIGPTGDVAVTGVAAEAAPKAITFWDEQLFSEVRGYPRSVFLDDQRLILGGSRDVPNKFLASVPGEFHNFDLGNGDDGDAIDKTIFSRRIVEIIGFSSFINLQIFTGRQEFYVDTGTKGAITPGAGNMSFQKQTAFGSSDTVKPVEFDGSTLFVTRAENKVREFIYNELRNAYTARNITSVVGDIINDPIDFGAVMEDSAIPEQYAYLVNGDGTLAVYFSEREENLAGWSLWTTDGTFKSVRDINGKAFATVEREIDGNTLTNLEIFTYGSTLDSSVAATSEDETATWGPYVHLANETVQVTSGGLYLGEFTIDGDGYLDMGEITADSIEVGLNYTPTLTTMTPEVSLEDGGVSFGQVRHVGKVVVDMVSVLSLVAEGNQLIVRQVGDDFSQDLTPITGKRKFSNLGWSTDGKVTITQEIPLDAVINGVLVGVEYVK